MAAVLVLVTAAQVWVLVKQQNILDRQTGILGEQVRLTRAWVGGVEPNACWNPPINITAIITIRNFGQSPARNLKHNVNMEFRNPDDPPPALPTIEAHGSSSVLQPTQDVTARDVEQLAGSTAADIAGERLAVWFSGVIAYEDIFGYSHQTTFRYVLIPSIRKWKAWDTGNTAD
jgi:hypothetical protein